MFFLFTNWNMFTIYQFSICSQTHPARSALSLSLVFFPAENHKRNTLVTSISELQVKRETNKQGYRTLPRNYYVKRDQVRSGPEP